jgi:hypothetical protein
MKAVGKITKIEIVFPVPVVIAEFRMDDIIKFIRDVIRDNPQKGMVMWPAEFGSKIVSMPETQEDDEKGVPLVFDDTIFYIGVCIRKEWL